MRETYDTLMAYVRQTSALGQVAGLVGWDQETMMPKGAADQRAEWSGALSAVIHARKTDPKVGEWLERLDGNALDDVARANLRLIRRSYTRNTKVPAELATRIATLTSKAQGIWAEARAADDFEAFAPTLKEVLELRRQEAAALSDGGDLYDALLDDYEPGMTGAVLDDLLGRLRVGLVDLRRRISESAVNIPELGHHFDSALQMQMSRELAGVFGYDWNRGRLDKAVHPFSSGSGTDTRITTRIDEANPFNCFYSTIHEVGHSCYEQGIAAQHLLTPVGRGASMGVHESQSRIFENQLGRSEPFCGWLFKRMTDVFGDFGVRDAREFFRVVNRVGQGYIRTEADEVQYNLHVMLRFSLERQLILGELEVDDLQSAWNARFLADFGFAVDRPSNGVLQDVHWSVGLFGYFPTYSLGNIYAGGLYQTLRSAVPLLDDDLADGKTGAAMGWLQSTIHRHGGMSEPADIITNATGQAISEKPLLAYLEKKFGDIYQL